jgi:hypothetical protein
MIHGMNNMKTKKCKKCKQIKILKNFWIDNRAKSMYHSVCKNCCSLNRKVNHKLHPEFKILQGIKTRCNNKNHPTYKYYGGRGIKCLITIKEICYLMKRDKYFKLNKPEIDRKDNNGNYELNNCQFIEKRKNIGKKNRENFSKPIIQIDLKGNLIKEWESITLASKKYNVTIQTISYALRNKTPTFKQFLWRYK